MALKTVRRFKIISYETALHGIDKIRKIRKLIASKKLKIMQENIFSEKSCSCSYWSRRFWKIYLVNF